MIIAIPAVCTVLNVAMAAAALWDHNASAAVGWIMASMWSGAALLLEIFA